MEILTIVKNTASASTAYDTTAMDYDQFISTDIVDYNATVHMIVQHLGEVTSINAKSLFSTIPHWTVTNWAGLITLMETVGMGQFEEEAFLPEHMLTLIDGKVRTIPSPVFSDVVVIKPAIVSANHSPQIDIDYGSKDNPTDRNRSNIKWKLKEVIYKHTDLSKPVVNFSNSLPIINGVACFPLTHNYELYAINGTEVLPSVVEHSVASMLIDFSPLGNLKAFQFKDCGNTEVDDYNLITLPDTISFDTHSIIVVIAGRLFFMDKFNIRNNKSFTLNLNLLPIPEIALSNKRIRMEYITNTNMYKVPVDNSVFREQLFKADQYESFIVAINTPGIETRETSPVLDINGRVLKMRSHTGLCRKTDTLEVIDYSKYDFDDGETWAHIAQPYANDKVLLERGMTPPNHIGYSLELSGVELSAPEFAQKFNVLDIIKTSQG